MIYYYNRFIIITDQDNIENKLFNIYIYKSKTENNG